MKVIIREYNPDEIAKKFAKVKRIYETSDYFVVNSLLKDKWEILGTYKREGEIVYSLIYIPEK